MSSLAVLGCMFGDEAKAKIVDVMAAKADIVVRFQGGSNAGHTIVINGVKSVLNLIPSGIFHPEKICVLANGVVIDPFSLQQEINRLKEKGVEFKGRFFVDPAAHVVLPLHKQLDASNDDNSNQVKIGTTKRGIGPCYSDKIARKGLRIGYLTNKEKIKNCLVTLYAYHKIEIDENELNKVTEELYEAGCVFSEYFKNVPYFLNEAHKSGKKILFEGAQGTLLDIDYGTYPFVTSSHTCSGGISIGCGLAPKNINEVLGVYKSYFTRVGEGPFVTELEDETGQKIREQGNEYGATTGRPRRCGWFDAVAAKFTAMINGVDYIALTLLDVLTGFDKLKVCTSYSIDGTETDFYPSSVDEIEKAKPVYVELDGWTEDITKITNFNDLPENAKKYVYFIEQQTGIKVKIVSVGPNRSQTIFR